MEHDAFRYDFTLRELIYFLFRKKLCPECKRPMIKHKTFETREGWEFKSRSNAPFRRHAKVKHYLYTYSCPLCARVYTLHELAEMKR